MSAQGWAPDWYRQAQREQAQKAKAIRELAESRVHAILGMEPETTARALLFQLVNLDPCHALEMLQAGGHDDRWDDEAGREADSDPAPSG
jgi:hypothetical protein